MTKTARVDAALNGHAVDHVPVSAWWHDYEREWSAEQLAEATLDYYHTYDWDYIKVNPRFSYYAEDWGATYRRYDDRMPEIDKPAVSSPEDLHKIGPLDVTQGAYGQQVQALRLIAQALADEAPFIQTVFSPLAVMTRLTGSIKFTQKLMREAPDELLASFEPITRTLIDYSKACVDAGASGIFYAAVEWGTADNISWEDYERFGTPFDVRILEEMSGSRLNVLHVCRERNHLLNVLDYPVAAFHWDVHGAGNPNFTDVLSRGNKAVMGGVAVKTLLDREPSDITAEANKARAEADDVRFLLAPGCSINPATMPPNLHALVEAAR
ncbi:MAG: uroporphyrinogen decarboxylase family protein [Chloroflexota bacterium]